MNLKHLGRERRLWILPSDAPSDEPPSVPGTEDSPAFPVAEPSPVDLPSFPDEDEPGLPPVPAPPGRRRPSRFASVGFRIGRFASLARRDEPGLPPVPAPREGETTFPVCLRWIPDRETCLPCPEGTNPACHRFPRLPGGRPSRFASVGFRIGRLAPLPGGDEPGLPPVPRLPGGDDLPGLPPLDSGSGDLPPLPGGEMTLACHRYPRLPEETTFPVCLLWIPDRETYLPCPEGRPEGTTSLVLPRLTLNQEICHLCLESNPGMKIFPLPSFPE